MKPGDHPLFFELPAPEGQSRESTIMLDRHGRWFHDGEAVTHPGLRAALPTWIRRHPTDGRLILSNGYDWCYFTVEDTPYFVDALALGDPVLLRLSDGSAVPLDPATLSLDAEGILRCRVKGEAARFGRHAQLAMEPLLCDDDPPAVQVGAKRYPL
jgi:uncharacterized protein